MQDTPGVCGTCGLPKELCVCEQISAGEKKVKLYIDSRKFGKVVTVVEIEGKVKNIDEIAKKLKKTLACGGSVEGHKIELQGKHIDKVRDILKEFGFDEKNITLVGNQSARQETKHL